MSATDCPLHGTCCRPADPEHDEQHRTHRARYKLEHYATIYGGPSSGTPTPEQQAVYAHLASIPRRPVVSTSCPLHGMSCNPEDPVHATAHRNALHALKTFHYALLYSHGSDSEAQRQAWETLERIPSQPPVPTHRPRLRSCVEQWPGCSEGDYNPHCCRFPKSCSCTVYDDQSTPPELLESS